MQVEISQITSAYESSYRQLVHEALVNDHECFRISPNDELDMPFNSNTTDGFTLGAFVEKQLVGAVTFTRLGSNREKLRHKCLLGRMIVDPRYRGQGIGKKLISAFISKVREINGIEQINLTVIPTNEKAKLLYEQFGFETFASEKNAIKWKGKYYQEDQMVLFL